MQTPSVERSIRAAAFTLGILFLLLGLVGFLPNFVSVPEDAVSVNGFGYVLGLFPTNYLHNAIRILVGLWGLAASTSLVGSITFNQIFAVLYFGEAFLGLFPGANTLFGRMPLYGNDVWLNVVTAAAAAYYGFVKPASPSGNLGTSTNP
ncbi:MAG: DUF4383 domain-containing protein [Stenomitos frigidus ULC029]